MDIRTKLIFALVAASLGSMLVLGLVVSPRVEAYLRDGTVERLDQLVESRRQALELVIEGWQAEAAAIAGSEGLVEALSDDGARLGPELAEALGVSPHLRRLSVYGATGDLADRAVAESVRGAASGELARPWPAGGGFAGVRFVNDRPWIAMAAPIATGGTLVAEFAADELVALTDSYNGLGQTGETLVVVADGTGGVRTLHGTRHGPTDQASFVVPDGDVLAGRALAGVSESVWDGTVDYRGEPVWGSTRLLPETEWGVVVKVDEAEELPRYLEFRGWLTQTTLILSAFVIVVGLGLGLRFAAPIHELAEAARRIGRGEMEARATVMREDEVGVLARTFNDMADELEARMALLREFRIFFDVSIDLMCMAGTDGYFKRVNPAFERNLGWSESELLQSPFYAFVHPDDMGKTEAEVEKLAQGIPTISFENRYRCKDGTYKLLRWTAYPADGVLYSIAHVLDDAPAA